MVKWTTIVGGIAAVSLMGGALGYYNFVDKKKLGLKSGEVCPDFAAQIFEIEGDTFTLGEEKFTLSENKGSVCVINFWEKWCSGCIEELHIFNELYEYYDGEVKIVAAVGKTSGVDIAEDFLNDKGWTRLDPDHDWAKFTLPFVYLPTATCEALGCIGTGLPRTVIVDERGVVAHEKDGTMTYNELRGILDKLLAD